MGQFPLDDPENRKRIDGWRNQPGMMGLRWALLYPDQQKALHEGKLDWVWPAAEKEGIPVATMAGLFLRTSGRSPSASAPEADHRPLRPAAAGKGRGGLRQSRRALALAKLPNVAVKATGAPGYSTQPYPFKNLHDGLHRIFDAYGPDRFFWGTDITRMPCTYRQCVTFFTEELPWLKGQDLEKVMGRGLAKWIGWNYKFD